MFDRHKSDKHDSAQPFDPVEHLPQLDGLRGVAILLVLVLHFHQDFGLIILFSTYYLPITTWGWVGVDLFFVLSGFLITSILWRYKSSPRYFSAFYGRRFLRIFPIYYLFLFVILFLVPMLGYFKVRQFSDLWYWLYASNVAVSLYGWGPRHLATLWSLAMEEQYYLVWPFVIRFGNRAYITSIGCALVLLGMALRFELRGQNSPFTMLHAFPLAHLDSLIIGSMIALWRSELAVFTRGGNASKYLIAGLLTIPVCLGAFDPFALDWIRWPAWGKTFNYTFISLYFGILLLIVLEAQSSSRLYRIFSFAPLRHLGKYSYAIYLIHVPLDELMRGLHLHPMDLPMKYQIPAMIPYFTVMTAAIYALAALSWWLIESRCLKLKRYVPY